MPKLSIQPFSNSEPYNEMGQISPMRWVNLYREEDKLTAVSHWWKCKDFMNDVVIGITLKKYFHVYGFKNQIPYNEKGLYLGIKNIEVAAFKKRLAVVNAYLTGKGFPKILWITHDKGGGVQAVLFIPMAYWKNTFSISFITSLIRSCSFEIDSITDVPNVEETLTSYWQKADALFVPEEIKKMNELVFKNYQYSKENHEMCGTSTMHNAGLQTWINCYASTSL